MPQSWDLHIVHMLSYQTVFFQASYHSLLCFLPALAKCKRMLCSHSWQIDLFLKSGILGVRTVICRWSDQIFMSRQHRHIWTGLLWSQCRHQNYIHRWCSFTNWSISHQSQSSRSRKQSRCQAAKFFSDCCSLLFTALQVAGCILLGYTNALLSLWI